MENYQIDQVKRWVNKKTGNLYIVLGEIVNANNDAPAQNLEIVYQRADKEKDPRLCFRKHNEFYQKFTPYI